MKFSFFAVVHSDKIVGARASFETIELPINGYLLADMHMIDCIDEGGKRFVNVEALLVDEPVELLNEKPEVY